MPQHKPIPEHLISKWSTRIAKDLQKLANEEHDPDRLEWFISPGHSGCEFVPPSQVTEKVVFSFIFHGRFTGKPDNGLGPNTKPDKIEDSKYTIKRISARKIKKR